MTFLIAAVPYKYNLLSLTLTNETLAEFQKKYVFIKDGGGNILFANFKTKRLSNYFSHSKSTKNVYLLCCQLFTIPFLRNALQVDVNSRL